MSASGTIKDGVVWGYLPPVHVSLAADGQAPLFRAVDAAGREVGLFRTLGALVHAVDLDDIVTD